MTDDPRLARRAFLARSALASGALVIGAPGCGASLPSMRGGESDELLSRLDRGLDRVRSVPRGEFARHMTWLPQPEISEVILRKTLETLVIADVARSLPEDVAVRGGLAEALGAELPVLETTMQAHYALLARIPGHARRELTARVRREPELPTEIAGWLDRHAAELGTARESRFKLRAAAHDVKVRLRRQSADAVIDGCVAKVERVVARSGGTLGLGHAPRAQAMISAIWQQVDGLPTGGASALTAPLPEPPEDRRLPVNADLEWARFVQQSRRPWSARWARPGDQELEIGAVMMPFGLLSCGLMLIIGLIVLLVGVGENASWDGRPRRG